MGGPRLLLYKFISSVDIKLSKQREEELNRLMCSLDDVVDSALGQASNMRNVLNDGIEFISESNALYETKLKEEKSGSDTILDCPKSEENDSFNIIGSMMVTLYNTSSNDAEWASVFSVINDNVIKNVIVEVDSDLIVLQVDDLEVNIGRLSTIGNFASQKIEGSQPIKHLNFAMFCLKDKLYPCIICITNQGAISVIMISIEDDMDVNILSCGNLPFLNIVNIQKSIYQSHFFATYIVDEFGNFQTFHHPNYSPDHYLICVLSLSIKIFLFQHDYSHSLFQDIHIDSKDGMIIRSGLFSTDSRLFLGVLHISGLLQVFSIPDLSEVFKDRIICDIQ